MKTLLTITNTIRLSLDLRLSSSKNLIKMRIFQLQFGQPHAVIKTGVIKAFKRKMSRELPSRLQMLSTKLPNKILLSTTRTLTKMRISKKPSASFKRAPLKSLTIVNK